MDLDGWGGGSVGPEEGEGQPWTRQHLRLLATLLHSRPSSDASLATC